MLFFRQEKGKVNDKIEQAKKSFKSCENRTDDLIVDGHDD